MNDRAKEPANPKYDCSACNDKGFVRVKETDQYEVVPCPHCNEDGMDEVTG